MRPNSQITGIWIDELFHEGLRKLAADIAREFGRSQAAARALRALRRKPMYHAGERILPASQVTCNRIDIAPKARSNC